MPSSTNYHTPLVAGVSRWKEAHINGPAGELDYAIGQTNTALSTLSSEVESARGGETDLDTRLSGIDTSIDGLKVAGICLPFPSADMPGDGVEISIILPYAITFPASLTGSSYYGVTSPTASAVVSIKKEGTEFGTLTVATDNSATFASASGATFSAGERLSFLFPTPQDSTWAGVSITLKGTRS